ncbi:hypothetical protein F5Y13DRAFT_187074 [Hypoxylon sp. FL1857]|nr:hypothetical protein F5Y13DRAFT_187074 [Hypoxylon sp. FL1857]
MSLCHFSLLFPAGLFLISMRSPHLGVDPISNAPLPPPLQLSPLGYHMASVMGSVMGGCYEGYMGFGWTKWLVKFSFFYHLPSRLPPRLPSRIHGYLDKLRDPLDFFVDMLIGHALLRNVLSSRSPLKLPFTSMTPTSS